MQFLFFSASVHERYIRLIIIIVFLTLGIFVSWLLAKRKQAEDNIKPAYTELNQIINSFVDGICVIDRDSNILRVNKSFLALFGVNESEVLGKRCHEVCKCFKCHTSSCPLVRILNGEEYIECEVEKEQKDGNKIPLILSAVPFRGPGGDLIGVVVNFRNITKHKQLENQLIHAQKMESIGRLASNITHDFNNLLTLIIGNAEYVLMLTQHDEPIYESINIIKNTADRCVNLTRQLLTFSRHQHIESCSIILNDMLKDMVKMFRSLIGKHIDIETLMAENIWRVKAEPGKIEQVLINLVVNARDAMPERGKITIETANVTFGYDYVQNHADTEPGDYVMIAVCDTGVGMSEETMSHIFEPFFTTKEKGKGTGLGLSICYGIVKQNGGNICVSSETNHGTTFKIYFPREKDETLSFSLNELSKRVP